MPPKVWYYDYSEANKNTPKETNEMARQKQKAARNTFVIHHPVELALRARGITPDWETYHVFYKMEYVKWARQTNRNKWDTKDMRNWGQYPESFAR